MKKIIESRALQTVLLILILVMAVAFYGATLDMRETQAKMAEKITVPVHGTTTTYATYTQKEYIDYLLGVNKELFDAGTELRDRVVACENK